MVLRRQFLQIATMIGGTVRVIAQHFDHVAIGDPAPGAVVHHSFQFGFQGLQPGDPAFDDQKLGTGDSVNLGAGLIGAVGQAQKVADRLQRETKLAGVADEGEPVLCGAGIKPLVAGGALGTRQKADLLVITDGRHLDPGSASKFSDGQHDNPLNL